MLTRLILSLFLTACCAMPLAQTQDPAPSPPTTANPADENSVEDEEGEEEEDSFRPTEKINVDSSVSFPVDI